MNGGVEYLFSGATKMAQTLTSTMYLLDIVIHHLLEIIKQITVLIHNWLTYRGIENWYTRSSVDESILQRDVRAGNIHIIINVSCSAHGSMQWILESLRNKYLRIHEYAQKHIPIYLSKYTNSYIHKHTYMPHIQALVVWTPIFSSKYFLICVSSQQLENILPNLFNFTTKKHICKCRHWLNRLHDH